MINKQTVVQLGKSGITDNFIETLENAFSTHTLIRLNTLKSSGRNKESIVKMADEIVSKLKGKYNYRIIGFTIILRKLSNKK